MKYNEGTYEKEGGQKDQRNAGDVDANINLDKKSVVGGRPRSSVRAYRVMVIRSILGSWSAVTRLSS